MSPPDSAHSFDEGPSMDSGIGLPPSPARTPPDASHLPRQSSRYYQPQSSYEALHRQLWGFEDTTPVPVDNSNKDSPYNTVRFVRQTALPPSQPASTTSLKGDGRSVKARNSPIPPRPQTPYPHQLEAEANEIAGTGDAEEVLGPQKGRKTPVPMNIPKLQWDLTKPLFVMPSRSTLEGEEEADEKEEAEAERCSVRKVERASTPIPTSTPTMDNAQHRKAKSALPPTQSSLQIYTVERQNPPSPQQQPSPPPTPHIPALLRVLDANLHPQPHQLSSLPESDERSELSQPRSQLSSSPCTAAPPTSVLPSPSLSPFSCCHPIRSGDDSSPEHSCLDDPRNQNDSGSLYTQRTRETDPYAFTTTETLGLQTAHLLPVQRVARADVRCGHIGIAHRRCCGVLDLDGQEQYEELRGEVVGGAGKMRFGTRVRRAWDRLRVCFCRK